MAEIWRVWWKVVPVVVPVVVLVPAAMCGSVCVNSQPQPCRQKLMKTPCGELVTSFGER